MRKIVLAIPLLVLCSGFAEAQTQPEPSAPPAAPASPAPAAKHGGMMKAVRPACRADIKSLCADVQPGGGRIAKCIRAHESALSTPCRDALTQFRQSRLSDGATGTE